MKHVFLVDLLLLIMPTVVWLSTNSGTIFQSSTACDQNLDLWTFHKLVNSAADSLNFYCILGCFKIIHKNQDNKKYHTLRNLGFGSVWTCLSAGQCGGCPFSGCGGSRSSHPEFRISTRDPLKTFDIRWSFTIHVSKIPRALGNKIPSPIFFGTKYVKTL